MRVTFFDINGAAQHVEGRAGENAMECAKRNAIDGIIGECGGAMACATCHAYVDPRWIARLDPPEHQERDMIDGCIDVRPESRLTCQVILEDALDGIVFTVPDSQV
ncbi:2Fe-2S iron-sulfur cluster-binding protein [Croceicoccus estronivorus]|uniref:2Fe-2S iron-sulfur cluster-binding protein n=1 Tax=Croceicoccus estronivorus TaxID=1172626 RepID=UPI000ACC907B|nr:2Fe-2S iron-sulfur cluster-binding protein [Croceicoccus estronivorus]